MCSSNTTRATESTINSLHRSLPWTRWRVVAQIPRPLVVGVVDAQPTLSRFINQVPHLLSSYPPNFDSTFSLLIVAMDRDDSMSFYE